MLDQPRDFSHNGEQALVEIFIRPEDWLGIAIAGLVVLLMLAGGIGAFLWRRFVPLKPIPLDVEAWSRFEQRRWTESAKALRHFISFVVFVALLAGTIGVPVLLGVAESPRWYLNEWWIGLFFGAVVVGIVCWYVISGRVRDRCPKCHSPQLAKAMARDHTWIYVCSACAIVWRTTYSTRSSDTHLETFHHHH